MTGERLTMTCAVLAIAAMAGALDAQMPPDRPAIVPTGLGEAIDRDVTRLRAATAPFRSIEAAVAAGYPQETNCIKHASHGAMGYHHTKKALRDGTLDVEQPEVLVYEKLADGTFKLNGVEYIVPITAWTKAEPPTIMGQPLKRADSLGFWYLHVWSETVNPSGLFADWNPNVKC